VVGKHAEHAADSPVLHNSYGMWHSWKKLMHC